MFVQLWNLFLEELKTKHKDYIHICNGRPFCEEEKKMIKTIYIHYNFQKYRKYLPC